MCDIFLNVFFFTFQYSFLGQVWYLVVSIPDLCLFFTFIKDWCDMAAKFGMYLMRIMAS